MIRKLSITIVIDDAPGRPGLIAEHGLSFWIEADNRRILFDTGQSDALLHNAKLLGIDLAEADAIVLSHGHYDHTGGLAAVLDLNRKAALYCHQAVVVPRYGWRPDSTCPQIGISSRSSASLFASKCVQWASQPRQIDESVWITGTVPRATSFEDTGGRFFLDTAMQRPDPIDDDLSMWVETPTGIVIITGCCHAGIVNAVRYVEKLRPGLKIHAIIGGLHLLNASEERIERTITELERLRPERIVACHCTGEAAVAAMRTASGARVMAGATGMKVCLLKLN